MLLSAFKEKNVATILTRYQHKASNPSIRVAAFPNTVSAIPNLRSSANFQHQIAISILNISAPQAYPLSLSLCSARMHPRVKPLSYIEICWPPSIPSKVSFSQTHPQFFFFFGSFQTIEGDGETFQSTGPLRFRSFNLRLPTDCQEVVASPFRSPCPLNHPLSTAHSLIHW